MKIRDIVVASAVGAGVALVTAKKLLTDEGAKEKIKEGTEKVKGAAKDYCDSAMIIGDKIAKELKTGEEKISKELKSIKEEVVNEVNARVENKNTEKVPFDESEYNTKE